MPSSIHKATHDADKKISDTDNRLLAQLRHADDSNRQFKMHIYSLSPGSMSQLTCEYITSQTFFTVIHAEHTHTHTQLFYGSVEFVRDNPGEPVPEETFTHYTHRGHQSSLSCRTVVTKLNPMQQKQTCAYKHKILHSVPIKSGPQNK